MEFARELGHIIEETSLILDTEDYIKQSIIPRMMQRRGRTEPLTETELVMKLYGTGDKPGEMYELQAGELQEKGSKLTPAVASEIADIVYYISQPNCPEWLYYLCGGDSGMFQVFGVNAEQARVFCIIKYEARLRFGDLPNYKEIENSALGLVIESKFFGQLSN